jgi:hypothetical protein
VSMIPVNDGAVLKPSAETMNGASHGSLLGELRRYVAMPTDARGAATIFCDAPVQLDDWPDAKCLLEEEDIEQVVKALVDQRQF